MVKKKNIKELVKVIRSKNAGPYQLTFDIIFKEFEVYEKVKAKQAINRELIVELYNIKAKDIISLIYYDPAKAVKFTIVRPLSAGAIGDRDVYGAQQHAPLLDIELEI